MQEQERKHVEHQLYILGGSLPCLGVGMYLLYRFLPLAWLKTFFIPCIFYAVTGLYCPGCGGTRAAAALGKGHILLSFFYHPIVVYGAIIYLWFMISHTIEYLTGRRIKIGMKYRNGYLYLALVIVIINIAVKDIALTAFHIDILKLLDNTHALV